MSTIFVYVVGVLCVWYAWRAARFRNGTVASKANSLREHAFHVSYVIVMGVIGAMGTAKLLVDVCDHFHLSDGPTSLLLVILWAAEIVLYLVGVWRYDRLPMPPRVARAFNLPVEKPKPLFPRKRKNDKEQA